MPSPQNQNLIQLGYFYLFLMNSTSPFEDILCSDFDWSDYGSGCQIRFTKFLSNALRISMY